MHNVPPVVFQSQAIETVVCVVFVGLYSLVNECIPLHLNTNA